MAVTALAAALRASGRDIIGLGAGEPDFDTPQHIKDAAIAAINAGDTKYTNVDGTPVLKEAIIEKFKRDNSLTYEKDQILVSSGGKQTCYQVCMAVLNDGDEFFVGRILCCVLVDSLWCVFLDVFSHNITFDHHHRARLLQGPRARLPAFSHKIGTMAHPPRP